MIHLIFINLYKKLNKISCIFIFFSLLILAILSYYNANFGLKNVEIKLNFSFYTSIFFIDSKGVIAFILVFFIILISLMETISNSNSFDCYFITIKSRFSVIVAKIINYLIIIFFYLLSIYLIIGFIFFLRFKNSNLMLFIVDLFLHQLIESYILFLITFALITLTNNSFSVLVTVVINILLQLDLPNKVGSILNHIALTSNINLNNYTVSFNAKPEFMIFYFVSIIVTIITIYLFKDIKC